MKSIVLSLAGYALFFAVLLVVIPLVLIQMLLSRRHIELPPVRNRAPRPKAIMLVGPDGRPARPLFVNQEAWAAIDLERMHQLFGSDRSRGGVN